MATGSAAGAAFAHDGAPAHGAVAHSPGAGSGNLVRAPERVPADVGGDSVGVVVVLNPVFGNLAVSP